MARTKGARSAGFDQRRDALLEALQNRLKQREGGGASFRELAAAAGVSVATLRHYFGGRDALVAAVLERSLTLGAPYLAHMSMPQGPFEASVHEAVQFLTAGFRFGLGDIHTIGFSEGLQHPTLGPAFLARIIDPSVDALAKRLAAHASLGEADIGDARQAALMLAAPVIVAGLHQGELGGAEASPIDLDAFASAHASAFVRAFRM